MKTATLLDKLSHCPTAAVLDDGTNKVTVGGNNAQLPTAGQEPDNVQQKEAFHHGQRVVSECHKQHNNAHPSDKAALFFDDNHDNKNNATSLLSMKKVTPC